MMNVEWKQLHDYDSLYYSISISKGEDRQVKMEKQMSNKFYTIPYKSIIYEHCYFKYKYQPSCFFSLIIDFIKVIT